MVFDHTNAGPQAPSSANEVLAAEETNYTYARHSLNIDEGTTSKEVGLFSNAYSEAKNDNGLEASMAQIGPTSENVDVDFQPLESIEVDGEGTVLSRSPSLVPTEMRTPSPPPQVQPFEFTVAPGVIARDYAYHPEPIRPPPVVFPILTTYIWFHYNRWRVIKQKARNYLNAMQSAFIGCDLVYLMHFNWISMKDISWMDARDWFGEGLIHLYEHPQDVEITYGAKRPSPKSPIVKKWFSRFANCAAIEVNTLSKVKPQVNRKYEKEDLRGHGPFGEAIYRYFNHETEVFWPLYNYLIGKGPKPELSETMERVFEPVLNCHGGGVGGRGAPYERPRDDVTDLSREGTEPDEVHVDSAIITIEYSNVPAFAMYRKERAKRRERELRRQLREEEEARAKALARRRRKNHKWTHKKSHKVKTEDHIKQEIIDIDLEPGRRCTRSIAKAAKAAKEAGTVFQPVRQEATRSRKDKGKGKAEPSPNLTDIASGKKRKREEDAFDVEYEFPAHSPAWTSSDPGPSNRPSRRARRKYNIDAEIGPADQPPNANEAIDALEIVQEIAQSRGTKRKRSLAPEPSQGRIDAFKRLRLKEADTSGCPVTSPCRRNEESIDIPTSPVEEDSLSSSTNDPAQPVGQNGVEASGSSNRFSRVDEPHDMAGQMSGEGISMARLEPQPTAEVQSSQSSPLLSPQQPPPPPPTESAPTSPTHPIEPAPAPPPQQNPNVPRPLRRTETTLFMGQIYHRL